LFLSGSATNWASSPFNEWPVSVMLPWSGDPAVADGLSLAFPRADIGLVEEMWTEYMVGERSVGALMSELPPDVLISSSKNWPSSRSLTTCSSSR